MSDALRWLGKSGVPGCCRCGRAKPKAPKDQNNSNVVPTNMATSKSLRLSQRKENAIPAGSALLFKGSPGEESAIILSPDLGCGAIAAVQMQCDRVVASVDGIGRISVSSRLAVAGRSRW
jgi:hypothetical protein